MDRHDVTTPNPKRLCPECGLELPAPGGCPHCLLHLALRDDDAHAPQDSLSRRPPTGLQSRFFGDYEILGEISRGGMGVVYRARHLGLNRVVALKMTQSSQWVSPEARLRFGREVAAAAQLNHPHIVSLYESGEFKGTHFFTMRLVEGGTLAAHIKAAQPGGGAAPVCDAPPLASPARVAALLIKIARAVHHAHQRGILHRDLKPSNILIDPQGEPHVADFGLAKMLAPDSAVTFTESVLGSPNYMAPEQAAGQHGELTTATDVYGLGAILYEALTGAPPFLAATPLETIRKVLDEEPVAPRKFTPGLDTDLETICLKCLQKSPAARYRTAEEMADDLERWQKGLSIRARPVSPLGAAWRWGRRHPGFVLLGAGLLISLAALAVGATVAAWRIRSANQRTEKLVTAMQIQKAEDLFSEGETTKGLAVLAHVLRKEPAHPPVTLRLLSALQHRSYALPVFPTTQQGSPLAASTPPNDDAREWITLTQAGAARGWDLRSGQRLRTIFDLRRPIRLAAISDDVTAMLLGFRDGSVQLRCGAAFGTILELEPHADGLAAVAFSRWGRRVATVTGQANMRVWDATTGEPLTPWRPHAAAVNDVQFSPDERQCITVCSDGRIRFWLAAGAGKEPEHVLRQSSGILARFSANGRWLAVGQHDGGIRVWDTQDLAQPKWTLQHRHRINDLAFSADARLLLSASADDSAQVWNLTTGTPHAPPMRHAGSVRSARFSPDDQRVLTASHDQTARLWDTATGRPLTEEMPHASELQRAVFVRDGRRVLTTAHSGAFTVWELREPMAPTLRVTHRQSVAQVEFSPDGRRLASGSLDGEIRFTAMESNGPTQSLRLPGGLYALAFSPDGRWLAVGGGGRSVQLLEATNGQRVLPPLEHARGIRQLAFNPAGTRLLAVTWTQAQLWDTGSGQPVGTPLSHSERINSARYSRDGRHIVTTAEDLSARLWSGANGEPIGPPLPAQSGVLHAEFSPDGERVLLAFRGHVAAVVSVATRQLVGARLLHRGGVLHAAFNHDGSRVVTASEDRTAKVWAPDAPEPLLNTFAHPARVMHARFSPDGRLILTTCSDGAARLWDVASGHLIADPVHHAGNLTFACFSPDGRRVASSSRDGVVFIRRIPTWDGGEVAWLADLAERVARQRFLGLDRFEPLGGQLSAVPRHAPAGAKDAGLREALQHWLRGAEGQ